MICAALFSRRIFQVSAARELSCVCRGYGCLSLQAARRICVSARRYHSNVREIQRGSFTRENRTAVRLSEEDRGLPARIPRHGPKFNLHFRSSARKTHSARAIRAMMSCRATMCARPSPKPESSPVRLRREPTSSASARCTSSETYRYSLHECSGTMTQLRVGTSDHSAFAARSSGHHSYFHILMMFSGARSRNVGFAAVFLGLNCS